MWEFSRFVSKSHAIEYRSWKFHPVSSSTYLANRLTDSNTDRQSATRRTIASVVRDKNEEIKIRRTNWVHARSRADARFSSLWCKWRRYIYHRGASNYVEKLILASMSHGLYPFTAVTKFQGNPLNRALSTRGATKFAIFDQNRPFGAR